MDARPPKSLRQCTLCSRAATLACQATVSWSEALCRRKRPTSRSDQVYQSAILPSTAKGISIEKSFCHILCHIAILRAKSEQDGQKDSYSHPLCQRRGPIERRATASLERASSELLWLPCHRPSARGLRTMQGDHQCWKVLCESSKRYGPPEGGEQLGLHIQH